MSLLGICLLSSVKFLFEFFTHFFQWGCRVLSIFWIEVFHQVHVLQMFSSVCFLMVSFEEQKFNFEKVQFNIFLMCGLFFVSYLRYLCLTQSYEDFILYLVSRSFTIL